MRRTVYIIGSKGIPARYGGFETFVEKLTEKHKNKDIKYFVACTRENSIKSNISENIFEYNGATCFNVDVPDIGSAKAVLYDILALRKAIAISKKNNDENPIFYILACRIGPFISKYDKKIRQIGGQLFVNPDGHEWLREKWSIPVRRYWRISERLMVKYANLLICDSKNIEKYIQKDYSKYAPKTTYIAYGTDLTKSKHNFKDKVVRSWFDDKKISENNYYLVVGRFVPENNYESMIREFMKSKSKRDLVLITNIEQNVFYEKLKKETKFDKDNRIKFVGTVYNQQLLSYIRENAFAYLHGHEVGGTNPSLLEALASTSINLLLDVNFNREVGGNGALYWKKDTLNEVIKRCELLSRDSIEKLAKQSKKQVRKYFSWDLIIDAYEKLFYDIDSYFLAKGKH
nr:Cps8R [Streptococcus agalactiae]